LEEKLINFMIVRNLNLFVRYRIVRYRIRNYKVYSIARIVNIM